MASSKESVQEPRRNGSRLPPLSTSVNNELFHPNPHVVSTDNFFNRKRSSQRNKHVSVVPDAMPSNLKRRSSRFGLSSLFSRSKPLVTEDVQRRLGVQLECDESTGASTSADAAGLLKIDHQPLPSKLQNLPEIDSPTATLRDQASRTALQPNVSPQIGAASGSSTTWDPPPLFQAYSQAVRYATLRAPILSAETILRLNVERSSSSSQKVESYSPEVNTTRFAKDRKLKRPTTVDMLSKGDWTDKIFVLVTSGYLLQYAGRGLFDRLPEKILPLSKESAAFASDAIPGKPYVLQISQISNEDGTLDREASKSMFKSLGLRSQLKRSTSSFLLVFESPDELSAWMVVVRTEIQAMREKDHHPEGFREPSEIEPTQDSRRRPSERDPVNSDPSRFARMPDPSHNATLGANTISPEPSTQTVEPVDPASARRQSMATQQSTDSRTTSNTGESINQLHLDRLKESPRQSYASTAGKTASTSRDSSPGPSPVKLHIEIPQWTPSVNERRQTTSMYHGLVRNSVQQLPLPKNARRESTMSYAAPPLSHSAPTYTPQQQRTPSPGAPNFSVPTFSKRYSYSNNSPALSSTTLKPQTSPIALGQVSPSPPVISEEDEGAGKRASAVGKMQHLQKLSPRASNSFSPSITTPSRPAASCDPSSSSEGDRPFSRRFSSLEYSKGVSPIQLAGHSPPPHPPPTTALPAIPGAKSSSRPPSLKPPLSPLPPLPVTTEPLTSSTEATPLSGLLASPSVALYPRVLIDPSPPPTAPPEKEPAQGNFYYPPPTKALPPVPNIDSSSRASGLPSPPSTPSGEPTAREAPSDPELPQASPSTPVAVGTEAPHPSFLIQSVTTRELAMPNPPIIRNPVRPVSMQVRSQTAANDAAHLKTAFKTTFDLEHVTPPPTMSLPSPPRPTRNPPPPPSGQPPQPVVSKNSQQTVRELPLTPALPNPRSTISVISPSTNNSEEAAPHPFIPPIKISERKFRGSLDGPWNPAYSYGAPQRNFFDMGAI